MGAKECDNLIDYLVGELPDSEETCFKNHLKHCQSCSLELENLNETWFALSFDREDKKAPQSLKAEIMSHVFKDQSTLPMSPSLLSIRMKAFKKWVTPLITGMIAVLLICVVGLGWIDVHLRKIVSDYEPFTQTSPILIKNKFNLQPQNTSSKANGVVYLVHEGKQNRLIMQVHHIPQTKGTEVYQAWMLYDGKYWSCGTFRSNKSGEGVLTYLVPPKSQFKGFEITLEPNSSATTPHGKPIMKTF